MKLYVWDGPTVLPNYSRGIAIAFANNIYEAKQMIFDEIRKYNEDVYGSWAEEGEKSYATERTEEQAKFLDTDGPKEYSEPKAVIKHGGE